MQRKTPSVSLSRLKNLATIIIMVAKSKKNNQFQWSIQSIPDYKEHREKKFTRFILYIKSDISVRSTIARFVKILFPYQKGNYA